MVEGVRLPNDCIKIATHRYAECYYDSATGCGDLWFFYIYDLSNALTTALQVRPHKGGFFVEMYTFWGATSGTFIDKEVPIETILV